MQFKKKILSVINHSHINGLYLFWDTLYVALYIYIYIIVYVLGN